MQVEEPYEVMKKSRNDHRVAAALEKIETRRDSETAELLERECQEGRAEKGNNRTTVSAAITMN